MSRALNVAWWVGLVLVVLSWMGVVPPVVGWIGFALTAIGFVASVAASWRAGETLPRHGTKTNAP